MAGGIIISRDVGVSMSTWFFDHVAELVREQLAGKISDVALAEIFHGKDEACLAFISLADQPEAIFMNFYVATLEARARDPKWCDDRLWDEILNKARADPRWRGPKA